MRKLKLDLADIEVASFEPAERDEGRGTVEGHIPPTPRTDCPECPTRDLGENTCQYTHPASCFEGCGTMVTAACGGCV